MTKKMKLRIRLFSIPFTIITLVLVLASPAIAQLPLPHAFYGDIEINGEPAPVGTIVEVRGEGINVGLGGNPIITTEVGKYGTEGVGTKLIAQGDIEGNPVLYFYVNGQSTGQTFTWQSGEVTSFALSLTISSTTPPPAPPTGPPPAPPTGQPPAPPTGQPTGQASILQSVLFGKDINVSIDDMGLILETIEVSADLPEGTVEVAIKAGTIALKQDGTPLNSLTSEVDATPPPITEKYGGIILPCNFGPDGATFEPSIKITFHYDPADIPENTNEEDLVIAFYDNSAGEWVVLPSEVDMVNNMVVATISHFTSFAILVPQVETLPPAEEPPSTPVAPGPEESTAPAPTSPEPSAPAPEEPTELAPEEAPLLPPPPEQTGETDWGRWIIVIIAVIVGGALIFFLIKRTLLRGY